MTAVEVTIACDGEEGYGCREHRDVEVDYGYPEPGVEVKGCDYLELHAEAVEIVDEEAANKMVTEAGVCEAEGCKKEISTNAFWEGNMTAT